MIRMISEVTICKLCGRKFEAKGCTEALFYFSSLKVDLCCFIHCIKEHRNKIPSKKRFITGFIKNFLLDLLKAIVYSDILIIRIILYPLYAFLKIWVYDE